MKKLMPLIALAVLAAPLSHAAMFGKKDEIPDPNAPLTADFVESKGKPKLQGVKRVVIPNFYVQFVRDQTIERSGRLGSDSYTTGVRGIDDAALKAIADNLYDGFVAELATAGIEVVPMEELNTSPDFADIRKQGRVSPFIEQSSTGGGKRDENHQGVSILVAARDLPINVRYTIDKYWLLASPSDGFKISLATGPVKMSTAMKMPVVNVRLTMAFSTLKGRVSNSGGVAYNAQTTSFNFNADLYPRFVDEGTMLVVQDDKGTTSYSLAKPVIIKDLAYSLEKSGSTGSRGAGLLGALSRAATGQANQAADAYIDFQPEDFSQRVTERGREVAKLLLTEAIK